MTATAPTEPRFYEEARDRLVLAAILWVFDQSCSTALADLESAVEEYIDARNRELSAVIP